MFGKIKKNLRNFFLILFGIFILLGILLFKILSPKINKNDGNNIENKKNILNNDFYSNISLKGKGDINSKNYVTVLSDYGCWWSSKFYLETITPFLKQSDLNNIWLQYDFLVLDETSSSLLPTEGAYCVNEQGKFWEFHDKVFRLKEKYDKAEEAFTEENINNLAKSLDVYNEEFKTCMQEHRYRNTILSRAKHYLNSMDKLGVPTTFLNGKPLTMLIDGKEQAVGAIDINVFNQKIQEWLNN